MKYFLLCSLNMLALVAGQLLLKIGMKDKEIDSLIALLKSIFSPLVLCGLALYAFTAVLWLYILNKVAISYAYPIQALAYPIVLILAHFLLKEDISAMRWIGVGVIVIGVVIATGQ